MILSSSRRVANQGVQLLRTIASSIATNPDNIFARHRSTIANNIESDELTKCYYQSPKEGFVRTSPYDPITIPDLTLDQYLWEDIGRWENKPAATCVLTGRSYTFAQMRDHCAALAVRLQKKLKLKYKDVIGICLPNLPEYPIAVFGAIEAGLVVTTVNPSYTSDEIARQFLNSGAKVIIATADNFTTIKAACDATKKNLPIICLRTNPSESLPAGAIDFNELIKTKGVSFSDLKTPERKISDLVFLPFSSGTTGLPKGVMLTHRNITSNCEMVQTKSPFPPYMLETTETTQDILPCFLPFFHIYGLTINMISKLKLGCHLVTMPKFTPDDFLKSIEEYKATVLHLVPPIVLLMTNSPKLTTEKAKNIRLIMTGAAPIGTLDAEKFLTKFPQIQFIQGYGLTETSPVTVLTPVGNTNYASTGFVTASSEAKIVAFDDNTALGLGPNEVGELCIRGPHVMKCYHNNEEANKATFYPNKWLRTGDVGYYDEQGFIYITDRMKELIKVKGFQVPPAELEEILRDHPKIIDAAVVGCPHKQSGEVPKAIVVLRPNMTANEDEIKEYVASKVSSYKRLEGGVLFVNEIPKNASGKILRKDLKAKYC